MRETYKHFLIGAATAAHQVEGNNINSDCWVMENLPHTTYKEPSLDAVQHYERFREDLSLLKEAGGNAFRFTIEWARIEPKKGIIDKEELNHYRNVLEFCHENGITPIVTLHHFSSPKWLIQEGGWESQCTIDYFANYARIIVTELGGLIPYICTINEANIGRQLEKSRKRRLESLQGSDGDVQVGINFDIKERMALSNKEAGEAFEMNGEDIHVFLTPKTDLGEQIIMKSHQKARETIKELNPDIQVGITFSLHDHQVVVGGEEFAEKEQFEEFIMYLPYLSGDDFFGLQNYSRKIHDANGIVKQKDIRITKMGYEFYPEALAGAIRFVAKHWDKPIMITENGVSTDNDEERIEFIERALHGVRECVEDGIQIIGYLHWSLLDNFEWQLGYKQKFGLIEVDRITQKRYPKDSLRFLGKF